MSFYDGSTFNTETKDVDQCFTLIIPGLPDRNLEWANVHWWFIHHSRAATWAYYQNGRVDLKITAILSIGFFIGSLLGAKFAIDLPELFLKRMFGTLMLIIALKIVSAK